MRRSRPSRFGVLIGAAALLAGGCSDDGGGSADTRVPTSTAPAVEVTVLEDVEYETGEVTIYESPPLMDVRAPEGAEGLPLVVLLHGGGVDKDTFRVYDTLPTAIASRGAVVVVPNWNTGRPAMPEVADAVALGRCAIGFAVEHATEWGADPAAVTLVGHSGGANVASVIAFDHESTPPGCLAAPWDVDGLVLWEGDWALADPSVWDQQGAEVGPATPVLTPWAMLDGWDGPVTFVVTTDSVQNMRRCDDIDTWLPVRDPEGGIRAAFDAIGASDDGCVDPGEESRALAKAMTDTGVTNRYVELTSTGSNHTQLSVDDLELVAAEVYAMAAAER